MNVYVLPTGERMNPRYPQAAPFYDKGQTAYVLFKMNDSRTRPTRIMTSHGLLAALKIGVEAQVYGGQPEKFLGRYKVVGIHHFESGEMVGDVPDLNSILHCVVK